MITISKVSKWYGKIQVLKNCSADVSKGEVVVVCGPSGSGKSTLLHLLGGLETPDHGAISLDGHRKEIGFVFQFHYLLPDLSAVENVALPLLIARWKKRRAFDRAMELLRETGLGDRAEHPIAHLSGGEQQRVAVARALITEPKLLLCDEPTGNLDEAISEQIGRTLVDYAHEHSAITVVATHSTSLAGICDRLLTTTTQFNEGPPGPNGRMRKGVSP